MSESAAEKPFYIQRRRLGRIKFIQAEGKFGFIDAEDFREDVFFHHTAWDSKPRRPEVDLFVEFEIDEPYRVKENKLRATVVRLTTRPEGAALDPVTDPHLRAKHHPKARRRRPSWRNKDAE
ncbi:cold shock domain-containing protein [Roseimaritima sediminicola]|uniref:cold shock domain-containing protein n=1 Tax=Roseimaritima sediminicola TaxID=2662066 RepID=UPI0012982CD9|nr:cold shock domain-containing protein [Roseimaritima sediminicola]